MQPQFDIALSQKNCYPTFTVSLNPQQLEAVRQVQGPLLILAGAGTGKTRVLTHRIAHLVEQCGVPPARILAVTFTNKAAGEMRKRVEVLVGSHARELWVGTFHSTCVKILRRYALEAGLAPEFVIYDAADQISVIKQVLKDLNLDDKRFPPSMLVGRVSRLKDQLLTVEDFSSQAQDPFQKTLAKIYLAYEKILEANHAVDFGDLILRAVKLFEKHPALLKGYQKMWEYILVDEYQDTNHAQYRFVSLVSALHRNLCVVGDPDQSIYRWRGADLNNILNFERDYPDTKVIRLEQNYRSVQNILRAASQVIANNTLRKEKSLWSDREAGAKIIVAASNSDMEEAKFVVGQFQELHRTQQMPYSAMSIFYRTNAQSRAFEEVLRMAGVPYIIYGGVRFYERAEVKDAIAYLRILANPQDSISMKRIINVPARGIGKTTIDRVNDIATAQGLSFYEAAKTVSEHGKLTNFLDWLEALLARKEQLSLVGLLQEVLETSGTIRNLSAQGTSEASERLENLNELMSSLHDFETAHSEAKLTDYLEQIALITDLDQHAEGGVLPLMTLHLAKGLEFEAVAVVGLEEGLLPHSRSQKELEELEEERRLFYVGMTRAKKQLWLTHAWRRYLHGQEQYSLPSRFLEEVPGELTEVIGRPERKEEERASRYDFDDFDQTADVESPARWRVGAKVRHPDFGVGFVKASEKTSLGEKITIRFANGQLKKLIAEYAKLEKI